MIIDFTRRPLCHVIEFGHLHDHITGLPYKEQGRRVTRASRDFPRGVLAACVPGRIASHVAAVRFAVHPAAQEGALIVTPVYRHAEDGGFEGAFVVATRISPPGDDLDLVRTSAVALDWEDWSHAAPGLGKALSSLRADPVDIKVSYEERTNLPRWSLITHRVEPLDAEMADLSARAILATLRTGGRLALDARWAPTSEAALSLILNALSYLPADLRGHAAFAIGLSRPDQGFAISWRPDAHGDAPDGIRTWLAQVNFASQPLCDLAARFETVKRVHPVPTMADVAFGTDGYTAATPDDVVVGLLGRHALASGVDINAVEISFHALDALGNAGHSPRAAAAALEVAERVDEATRDALFLAQGQSPGGLMAALLAVAKSPLRNVRLETMIGAARLRDQASVELCRPINASGAERAAILQWLQAHADIVPEAFLALVCEPALQDVLADLLAEDADSLSAFTQALLLATADGDMALYAALMARFAPRDRRALTQWRLYPTVDDAFTVIDDALRGDRTVSADGLAALTRLVSAEKGIPAILAKIAGSVDRCRAEPSPTILAGRLRAITAITAALSTDCDITTTVTPKVEHEKNTIEHFRLDRRV